MAIPLRRADPANITAGLRTFFVTSSIAGKRNLLQSHRSANCLSTSCTNTEHNANIFSTILW